MGVIKMKYFQSEMDADGIVLGWTSADCVRKPFGTDRKTERGELTVPLSLPIGQSKETNRMKNLFPRAVSVGDWPLSTRLNSTRFSI